MNQNGTIYIATNLINGKQYIGQTLQKIEKRKIAHKKRKSIFSFAIKKYGFENFKWVSFSCPEKDLDWQETFLIKELNTLAPNGYNLETGGHVNKHHHKLTKEKLRKKHLGTHHSEITIQKMKKNNSGSGNPMFGVKRLDVIKRNKEMVGEKNPRFGKIGYWAGKKRPEITGEKNPMFGKHHEGYWKGRKGYWAGKKRPEMSGKNNPFYGIRRFGKDNPNYHK